MGVPDRIKYLLGVCAALIALSVPAQAQSSYTPSRGYDAHLRTAYEAYASGDFEGALYDYERILSLTENPRVQVRALISLAMIRLLPSSPLRDAEAAQMILDEIAKRVERHQLRYEFFGELELLEQVGAQEAAIQSLKREQRALNKSLQQRDELIRQLRDLSVEGSQ